MRTTQIIDFVANGTIEKLTDMQLCEAIDVLEASISDVDGLIRSHQCCCAQEIRQDHRIYENALEKVRHELIIRDPDFVGITGVGDPYKSHF